MSFAFIARDSPDAADRSIAAAKRPKPSRPCPVGRFLSMNCSIEADLLGDHVYCDCFDGILASRRLTPFSPRAMSRRGSSTCAARRGGGFKSCRCRRSATKSGCGPTSGCSSSIGFGLPESDRSRLDGSRTLPHALLAAGVELGGHVATHRQPAVAARADAESGPSRACCSAASTRWCASTAICCGRISNGASSIRSRTSSRRCMRPCWCGGTLLYVPKNVRIDEPLHSLSALSNGGVDLRQDARDSRRRRRGHDAFRNGQHVGRRRRLALRLDRADRRAGRPPALRQSAELGPRGLALRPSEGPRRPRGPAAVDDRRAGQPAGQSESARRDDRPGRRSAGQRRDVHRGPAASLVQHASASPGAVLQERPACTRRRCRTARAPCGAA